MPRAPAKPSAKSRAKPPALKHPLLNHRLIAPNMGRPLPGTKWKPTREAYSMVTARNPPAIVYKVAHMTERASGDRSQPRTAFVEYWPHRETPGAYEVVVNDAGRHGPREPGAADRMALAAAHASLLGMRLVPDTSGRVLHSGTVETARTLTWKDVGHPQPRLSNSTEGLHRPIRFAD